jgi:hypothetical protein
MTTTSFFLAIGAAVFLFGFMVCIGAAAWTINNSEPIVVRLSIAQPGDYQLKIDRRTGEQSMTRVR